MQYQRLLNDEVQDPLRSPESPTALAPHVDHSDSANTTRIPSPPPYSRPLQDQQRNDLEDTFDESIDEPISETQRLLEPSRQAIPESSSSPATLPVANDGVFSNMSAKPESERDKTDETPPAYEDAAADATPPYWHTAVMAPTSLGDFIMIEGLPAGNMLHFGWNLIISASFQFIGFMLTYLFHTTHAAKNGSRAGLGVTLVQFGFYVRSRGQDNNGNGNNEGDSTNNDIVAYLLMIFGWFIIIRSVADYIRVKRMEKIIATQPSAENIV